jgi:predicted DNA-binding transcriptional regulator AlpA
MKDFKPPLDTLAAAAYTGLASSTLEKLRVYGGGPRYLKLRRLVRYRQADLDDWLAAHIVSSTSDELSCEGGGAIQ